MLTQNPYECMKTVKVYSKEDFKKHLEAIRNDSQVAVISIECTPDCVKYYLEDEKEDFDNTHLLESSDRVLNLEFDDVKGPGNMYYKGHWMKAITGGQAREIIVFMEDNSDKDIVIHCKAGKSRSKAVGRFILDCYGDKYKDGNPDNPIGPDCNVDVLTKLKDKFYERNKIFWHVDNKTSITKEAQEFSGMFVHTKWRNKDYPGTNYEDVEDEDVYFLLGAVNLIEDYYWILLDSRNNITYSSCVGGWTPIYDFREYPNVTDSFKVHLNGLKDLDKFNTYLHDKIIEEITYEVNRFKTKYPRLVDMIQDILVDPENALFHLHKIEKNG